MKTRRIGLVSGLVLVMGCGGAMGQFGANGSGGGEGGGGISSQCTGDFGDGGPAAKLEGFLSATAGFIGTAAELDNALTASCRAMGADLGLSDSDMAATGRQTASQAACGAVSSKLRDDMNGLRAEAGVTITVEAAPPVCEVSASAYAECAGRCDASFDPGSAELVCEGGELRGGCEAECTGSCAAEVSGQCSGACEGTCEGGCTGVCNGTCEGTCATRGPNGECQGRCDGTCHGTCSAGCRGACSGQCVVSAHAHCEGECRGGCSVQFREPRCTGTVRPPRVDADCRASCDAQVNARAECRPGEVRVVIAGNLSSDAQERANRVKAALEHNLATFRVVAEKLNRLGQFGDAMVSTAGDLPSAVGQLGVQAAACVSEAAAALPRASASVTISIQVSASVTASTNG